jgi:monoamine oxidase
LQGRPPRVPTPLRSTELSAAAPHEGDYFGGGDVTIPGGYLALLESLTDGIQIQLGNRVNGVTTRAAGVTLNSNGVQTTHDHCVVTLPLGVMKTGAVRFDPPLPAEKQAAMKRLGMGLLDKVMFEFSEIFWDRNYEWFGYVGPDRGAWSQWFDLMDVSGRPTLVCFHAGRAAEFIEAKSDDEVISDAMAVLRSVFG